jgi:hypothetical protein
VIGGEGEVGVGSGGEGKGGERRRKEERPVWCLYVGVYTLHVASLIFIVRPRARRKSGCL